MALSYSILQRGTNRGARVHLVEITFDSSYTTGGLAVSANSCGLNSITGIVAGPTGSAGIVPSYDRTNAKLLAFWGDNTNAASAALIEVTASTNLATAKVACLVMGN